MKISKINEQMDMVKDKIESYPLESTVGTKKMIKEFHKKAVEGRNELINQQTTIFMEYKKQIFNILQKTLNENIPVEEEFKSDKERIKLLQELMKYGNDYNDAIEKLSLMRIIYDIDNCKDADLNKINNLLLDIYTILNDASIKIDADSFNYSMFTHQYGEQFLMNIDNPNFEENMKVAFEGLYWECPMIITHLKLNMVYLVNSHKKELETYCSKKVVDLKEKLNVQDDYTKIYVYSCNELEEKIKNSKNSILLFLNDKLNVNDYLIDSPIRKKVFNRFVNKEFDELNEQEKNNFYLEMSNLKETIEDLDNYYYFENVSKSVIERYKKKDTFKGVYSSKLKEVKKEENTRIKLYKSYINSLKPGLFKKNNEKNNVIKLKMNEQINKLNTLYTELNDAKVNENISLRLNDGSTLFDIVLVSYSFYGYLKNSSNDYNFEELIIKYFNFIYDPNSDFLKKVNILSDYNMVERICDKYKLLNINLNAEDLDNTNLIKTKKDVDMILMIKNLEDSNIKIEDIKVLCDIKKLE